MDRAHRIGQTCPVTVYRLLGKYYVCIYVEKCTFLGANILINRYQCLSVCMCMYLWYVQCMNCMYLCIYVFIYVCILFTIEF